MRSIRSISSIFFVKPDSPCSAGPDCSKLMRYNIAFLVVFFTLFSSNGIQRPGTAIELHARTNASESFLVVGVNTDNDVRRTCNCCEGSLPLVRENGEHHFFLNRHFYSPARLVRDVYPQRPSGQAVVTGVSPSSRYLPSF